jgi:hypothetical protein
VEYLVGVGVADAAEETRIGERALQGVVLGAEPRGEVGDARVEHFEPAAVEPGERAVASNEVERRAARRAGLGEEERPGWEIEGGQRDPPGRLRAARAPPESAGDHEVNDEEELILQLEHDPLSDPSERQHALSLGRGDRRLHRAEKKWTQDPDVLDRLSADARGERLQVEEDVGELGHG